MVRGHARRNVIRLKKLHDKIDRTKEESTDEHVRKYLESIRRDIKDAKIEKK